MRSNIWWKWRGLIAAGLLVGVCGCPLPGNPNDPGNGGGGGGGGVQNRVPSADAGANRTVDRGTSVRLRGSGTDPDGDTLSFAWTQVSGPAATLTGANTDEARFRANTLGTLTFELTVSDGRGGQSSDRVTITVVAPPARLFVVNNDTGRVTSHSTNELSNNAEPATALEPGAATSIFRPRSVVVTPGGVLFISREAGGIVAYNNALTADASQPADRLIDGNATLLGNPISLAYSAGQDLLFAGNASADSGVVVFGSVSTAAFNGNVAPVRTFVSDDRFPVSGSIRMVIDALWLDGQGRLYVSDTSGLNANSSRILVFNDAASASGATTPARIITSGSFGKIEDIVIDTNDRLYVLDGSDTIYVFDNASGLDRVSPPTRTITIGGTPTPQLHGIIISSDGVGYVSDRNGDALYTLNGIGQRNGLVTPNARLEGFESRISGPRQLALLEP